MDDARARHLYAGGDPAMIAKVLRTEWERECSENQSFADHIELLETMIASSIRVAVEEGITNG